LQELTQDLEDQRQIVREKNREIVELKGKLSKSELDCSGAENKVKNLLSDKTLLENEINGMQTEFSQICHKLSTLEDRDMLIKSYKEEIALLNANLADKNTENAHLNNNFNSLKLDYERMSRNLEIMTAKQNEGTKRIENLNNEMLNISVENKAT
jgi:chromosome segregation ATPase